MKIELLENDSLESEQYRFLMESINNNLVKELSKIGEVLICTKSIKNNLEKLKKEYAFSSMDTLRASKYMYMIKDKEENETEIKVLERLRILIQSKIEDDVFTYTFPTSYKTSLNWEVKKENLEKFIAKSDIDSTNEEIKKLTFAISKLLDK